MNCIGPSEPFKITVEKDIPHCVIREDGILAEREFSLKRDFGFWCSYNRLVLQLRRFNEKINKNS